MRKKAKKYWGFDTKNIDRSVRPQDDFYHYANGGWLKRAHIPPEEPRWGSFTILRYRTEQQLHTLVAKILQKKHYRAGSPRQLVADMFRSACDMKRRDALGIKPLAEWRAMVEKVLTRQDLFDLIAKFHVLGVSGFWATFIDQDSKDSSVYRLHLWQGGLGLPDRDYYLENKPEQKRVREAYVAHIRTILKLVNVDKIRIERMVKIVLDIETSLAKASMRKEDTRDAEKTYHKKTIAELLRLSPDIPWKKYFAHTGAQKLAAVIIGQPDFFKDINGLLKHRPLDDLKIYLEWHLINDSSSLLSEKFVRANFNFYKILTGSKKMRALWRRALGATNATVGEAVGQLYVKAFFSKSAKVAMDALVSDLFDAYEERIKKLSWMSAPTKRKAVTKLRMMSRKIGYPKKWKTYQGLRIKPDDFFGNIKRSSVFEHRRAMRKLRKRVDRGEWHMTPQTVNAYCNFNLNEIVFPAAILQWPFFDPRADAAVNYGGIGAVIGHEMTHGFDDQGSKFDGNGNMHLWWTTQDRKKFMRKADILVEQYNRYIAAGGVAVNGQLTLGENIADLGGVAIAYDAYQKHLAKTSKKDIGGFSPEERFFLGFAQSEQELTREEYSKTIALVDVHSPAPARINGPLANFPPFYKAFDVTKKNKLYRPPAQRAHIW